MIWSRKYDRGDWFAWYPVFCRDADAWVWLEWVSYSTHYTRDGRIYEYRLNGPALYRTADGSYWRCRSCREPVLARADGSGVCGCARFPRYVNVPYESGIRRERLTASPWEPMSA